MSFLIKEYTKEKRKIENECWHNEKDLRHHVSEPLTLSNCRYWSIVYSSLPRMASIFAFILCRKMEWAEDISKLCFPNRGRAALKRDDIWYWIM
ncbi:hypothetical protein TNCT_685381 [Trichonephila clavata]|uniref:Uncharacterized protein n=1 Tax=Trichonephila clavata TaxID=2740835 RepID=A0A8X6G9J0_TRICU|nr:hypothetical protein TNCT_685381 [Trichonephila clavata]